MRHIDGLERDRKYYVTLFTMTPRIGSLLAFAWIALSITRSLSALASQTGPVGSFRLTCSDVVVTGHRVGAQCQDAAGVPRSALFLDYTLCEHSSLVNDDGKLRCDWGSWWNQRIMAGSYRETCRDVAFDGIFLSARCRTRDGGWTRSSLPRAGFCKGDVVSDDGSLRCRHVDVAQIAS